MSSESCFKEGMPSSTSITGFKSKFRLPPRISYFVFQIKNVHSIRFLFAHVETCSFSIFERYRLTKKPNRN